MSPPLDDLQAFACVARHRSFRKAAQELQLTPSALSHSMSRLEQQLGMRLLHRTTRSVSATEAGELLLQQLLPALGQIDLALEQLNQKRSQPAGRLRLNVPRAALQLLLAPKLAAWSQAYPDITLEVVGNDALVDIVAEGFDAGIRFDETLQQDMVAVPLGPPIGFGVCAAPAGRAGRASRIPQHVSRLGGRAHELPARRGRDGAGPRHRGQGGGGLPARRLIREAHADDGRLGAVPAPSGEARRCDRACQQTHVAEDLLQCMPIHASDDMLDDLP